jgi:hypothetical protein
VTITEQVEAASHTQPSPEGEPPVNELKEARRLLKEAATMVDAAMQLCDKAAQEVGGNEVCSASSLLEVAQCRIGLTRDRLKGISRRPRREGSAAKNKGRKAG